MSKEISFLLQLFQHYIVSLHYFQAVPYSRRDSDAFNKTFGSMEWNNEDKAEEEKRCRFILI